MRLISDTTAGTPASDEADVVYIGGIRSSRLTRAELAEVMVNDVSRARAGQLEMPRVVVATNGLVITNYHHDPDFRRLIDQADIVDVDGMPLVLATRLLCKNPVRERVATTDFVRDASAIAAETGVRFFFLGARDDRAAKSAYNLTKAYPGLEVVGTRNGYFTREEEDDICAQIVASGADVLWLGLGSPKQEDFAIRNRHKLAGLGWIRTCGGLFDFYSDFAPRAPAWMQNLGIEWMFRAWQEPRRLGLRYLASNPAAIYHILTKTHD